MIVEEKGVGTGKQIQGTFTARFCYTDSIVANSGHAFVMLYRL